MRKNIICNIKKKMKNKINEAIELLYIYMYKLFDNETIL